MRQRKWWAKVPTDHENGKLGSEVSSSRFDLSIGLGAKWSEEKRKFNSPFRAVLLLSGCLVMLVVCLLVVLYPSAKREGAETARLFEATAAPTITPVYPTATSTYRPLPELGGTGNNNPTLTTSETSSRSPPPHRRRRRFPLYGTPEFVRECGWTLTNNTALVPRSTDCTFYVGPDSNEGIARWVSEIASSYIMARQTGCRLLIGYGDRIELGDVIRTPPKIEDDDGGGGNNEWTEAPTGFRCVNNSPRTCALPKNKISVQRMLGNDLCAATWPVPKYRFAYQGGQHALNVTEFRHLPKNLPGFDIQTGMACSFGALLTLSPHASKFEPTLFTELLPTLRDPTVLVFALYVRTGLTDIMARNEEKGQNSTHRSEADDKRTRMALLKRKLVANCAIGLEREYWDERRHSKVVWMVLTDSPDVKRWVVDNYHGTRLDDDDDRGGNNNITREVLVTKARGVHTRSRRNPSTADFAEGFLDWYLLGESDAVIGSSTSFGHTGALRTARPLYENSYASCKEKVLLE